MICCSDLSDLTEALGQTKIVSTVSRAAIIPGTLQWKSTGRRIVKGPDELVELDSFLMTKVSIKFRVCMCVCVCERDKQTDRQTDRRTDGLTDGWMDGWMDGRMDGWMDGWIDR